ncbi:MAG: hypothetical protein AAF729_00920 [Pseudomonadota bacterium]
MMRTSSPLVAQRVPKVDFDQAVSCLAQAEEHAARIRAEAAADIAQQKAELAEKEADLQARIANAEATAYQQALDHETIAAKAKESVAVLDEAARLRAASNDLAPWLTDLVDTALRKMIGQIHEADLLAALVKEAIAERAQKEELNLRIAVADHDRLKAIVLENEDRFTAISAIVPDASLPADTLYLEGKGGFVSIGIEAQLTALRDHLYAVVAGEEVSA